MITFFSSIVFTERLHLSSRHGAGLHIEGALVGRLQSTAKPAESFRIDRICGGLCFVDHSAFRASQRPVLESRSSRNNTQDVHGRVARRTARTHDLTGRKLVCELRVGHEVLPFFVRAGAQHSLSPIGASDGAVMGAAYAWSAHRA